MPACNDVPCTCGDVSLASLLQGAVTTAFHDDPYLGCLAVLLAVGLAVHAAAWDQSSPSRGRFLHRVCSAPVLLVWTVLLGTVGLGFPGKGVLALTALAVVGSAAWLRRRDPAGGPDCGPGCHCHAARNGTDWELAPETTGASPAQTSAGGWINAVAQLEADTDTDWGPVARRCLAGVATELIRREARLHHLKLWLTTAGGSLMLTQTSTAKEPIAEGGAGVAARAACLVLNVRAEVAPEDLKATIEKALAEGITGRCRADLIQVQSLRPGGAAPLATQAPEAAR